MTTAEEIPADAAQALFLTEKEQKARSYSLKTLQKILEALHQDGLVVLKGVIDVEHIDALNKVMCEDADKIVADGTKEYNHNVKCK